MRPTFERAILTIEASSEDAAMQAALQEASGSLIVPTWLRRQSGLAVAHITKDWNEALSGIYGEGVDAFITWLSRQTRSANVVNFFVERDKRRGRPRKEPDGSQRPTAASEHTELAAAKRSLAT